MKSCAILVDTIDEGKVAIVVPNFSKDNVLKAIVDNFGVAVEALAQLSASMSGGMYTIKRKFFTSRIEPFKDYRDAENNFIFRIEYIRVISQ